jgi:hypothetical protein
MVKRHAVIALVVGATASVATSCADDGLGESFRPGDPDRGGDLARLYPVGVGDTLWYTFSRTFRPTTVSDPITGLLVGEKQTSGELCLEVTEVRDTATEAYADAPQTMVVADARVTGGYGSDEIDVDDQEARGGDPPAQPDPAVVDEALSGLWLSQLLFPSRGHGMSTAARKEFTTRTTPHQPDLVFGNLPFWEPRISVDHAWGGFDWYDRDCANHAGESPCVEALCVWDAGAGDCTNKAVSFVSDMLVYLVQNEGCTTFTSGDTRCDESHVANQACATRTDEIGCNTTPQCIWDNTEATCTSTSELALLWRDNISAGTGLQGNVLRQLIMTYQPNGILRAWNEMVVPDQDEPLPSAGTLSECQDSCMIGKLEFDTGPIERANCSF